MVIQTKFNIDDKVYFLLNDIAFTGKIKSIKANSVKHVNSDEIINYISYSVRYHDRKGLPIERDATDMELITDAEKLFEVLSEIIEKDSSFL